jgi:hypothetical protein
MTIHDLTGEIRPGVRNPASVEINYVVRDGRVIIANTRPAQELERAGVPRSQWNAVNRTGDTEWEGRVTDQLTRNKRTNEGFTNPISSGKKE